jgi:Tol biopolymer transport system component
LTPEGANYSRPIWTPDSKKITFFSNSEKPPGIYWQSADGSSLPERLTAAANGELQFPESWSPDGRTLSLAVIPGGPTPQRSSLWTLSREKGKPELFYDAVVGNLAGSAFSPDGKWVAYASYEGGQFGIYVQPFPPTGAKYQVSHTGGAWPVWSPNGSELFYRVNAANGQVAKMSAVTITTKPFPAFSSETVLPIRNFLSFQFYRDYDPMPNGREFVTVSPTTTPTVSREPLSPRFQIVLNWFGELQERVPVK